MRQFVATLLGCCALISAQGAEKDPQAARRLLDGAIEMISAANAETGVIALSRAGIAYAKLDKKRALELQRQAFAALPSVPAEDIRDEYATLIVRSVADLDVRAATELLRQVPKPAQAASAVVRQLLSAKQFDEAMELLALMPDQSEYPYEAASYLITSLPENDPRRSVAFGRATSAFAKIPAGPFPVMVERFGKQMPADLRNRAVSLLVERIQSWKDDSNSFSGSADDKDTKIEMHSPRQNDLREYVSVARLFEPTSVNRLVEQRPDVRSALATFGKERKPSDPLQLEPTKQDDDDDPFLPPFGIGMADSIEGLQKRIQDHMQSTQRADKVGEAMKKNDPAEAVRLARDLPVAIRAETLALIAEKVADANPELSGSVADSCLLEIDRLEDPSSRVPALIRLGAVYTKKKDVGRAHSAYARAFADIEPIWSRDTKADRPNIASRDSWPSIQATRMTAFEAAKNLGASAESLLSNINNNDLVLVARIHMAQALLGLPVDIHSINVRWTE